MKWIIIRLAHATPFIPAQMGLRNSFSSENEALEKIKHLYKINPRTLYTAIKVDDE